VADALSCRYKSHEPGEQRRSHEFVNADSRLNPEGEDSPGVPGKPSTVETLPRRSHTASRRLHEQQELCTVESEHINAPVLDDVPVGTIVEQLIPPSEITPAPDPEAAEHEDLVAPLQNKDVLDAICRSCNDDKRFSKIVRSPKAIQISGWTTDSCTLQTDTCSVYWTQR
jgi:hypothetical protein